MKAYKCDICKVFFEKSEKAENRRIGITLAAARHAACEIDLCDECYEKVAKAIGMEDRAYLPGRSEG